MCFPGIQWKRATIKFTRTECVKGSQRPEKGFFKYTGDKRKAKENVGPLLKEMVNRVTQDVRYCISFLSRSLPARHNPGLRIPETMGKGLSKNDIPLVEEDQVMEYLNNT